VDSHSHKAIVQGTAKSTAGIDNTSSRQLDSESASAAGKDAVSAPAAGPPERKVSPAARAPQTDPSQVTDGTLAGASFCARASKCHKAIPGQVQTRSRTGVACVILYASACAERCDPRKGPRCLPAL